jgi:hypothetical protein
MKKSTLGFLTASAFSLSSFAQSNEPVIMTINGKPVYKSEFENVYKKNNSLQFYQTGDSFTNKKLYTTVHNSTQTNPYSAKLHKNKQYTKLYNILYNFNKKKLTSRKFVILESLLIINLFTSISIFYLSPSS